MRRSVYVFIYFINFFGLNRKPKILIFCYHSIATDDWRFSVSCDEFKKQINHLLKSYQPASLKEIHQYLRGEIKIKKPSFVITFDDGYKDILITKDFLKKLNIKPTVFVLSDQKNADQNELGTNRQFLNTEDLLELKNAGWEIGCHSATHQDFSLLNELEIKKEIISSKLELEKKLLFPVEYFSYPKGRYNADVITALTNAGYTLGVSMDDRVLSIKTNPYKIPRVGVDNTHTFLEFKALHAYPAILFRRILKNTIKL